MANWYYSVGGKAQGPVTEAFLVEALKDGHLTLVDLVFQEGDTAWNSIGEVPILRQAFHDAKKAMQKAAQSGDPSAANGLTRTDIEIGSVASLTDEDEWVILRKVDERYEQLGPFTREFILEKLGSGEIEYSQYAWRPGFERWVRIGELDEFDRRRARMEAELNAQKIPKPVRPDGARAVNENGNIDVPSRIVDVPSRIGDVPSRIVDVPSRIGDVPSRIGDVPSRAIDVLSRSSSASPPISERAAQPTPEPTFEELQTTILHFDPPPPRATKDGFETEATPTEADGLDLLDSSTSPGYRLGSHGGESEAEPGFTGGAEDVTPLPKFGASKNQGLTRRTPDVEAGFGNGVPSRQEPPPRVAREEASTPTPSSTTSPTKSPTSLPAEASQHLDDITQASFRLPPKEEDETTGDYSKALKALETEAADLIAPMPPELVARTGLESQKPQERAERGRDGKSLPNSASTLTPPPPSPDFLIPPAQETPAPARENNLAVGSLRDSLKNVVDDATLIQKRIPSGTMKPGDPQSGHIRFGSLAGDTADVLRAANEPRAAEAFRERRPGDRRQSGRTDDRRAKGDVSTELSPDLRTDVASPVAAASGVGTGPEQASSDSAKKSFGDVTELKIKSVYDEMMDGRTVVQTVASRSPRGGADADARTMAAPVTASTSSMITSVVRPDSSAIPELNGVGKTGTQSEPSSARAETSVDASATASKTQAASGRWRQIARFFAVGLVIGLLGLAAYHFYITKFASATSTDEAPAPPPQEGRAEESAKIQKQVHLEPPPSAPPAAAPAPLTPPQAPTAPPPPVAAASAPGGAPTAMAAPVTATSSTVGAPVSMPNPALVIKGSGPTEAPTIAATGKTAPEKSSSKDGEETEHEADHEIKGAAAKSPLALANLSSVKLLPPAAKVTVLEVVPYRLSSVTPLLLFQTNAPSGERLTVRLKARSGDVLKYRSLTKVFRVVRNETEYPGVDLVKAGLPRGSYSVEVSAGEMHKTSQIFLGARDAKFASEIEHHLKDISFEQQKEKKTMFFAAKRFEGLAQDLSDNFTKFRAQTPQWRTSLQSWNRDVQQARAPLANILNDRKNYPMAYPDEMRTLSKMVMELSAQAKELDQAVTQKRDPASQSPGAIAKEFSRLKQEVAMISSRRAP